MGALQVKTLQQSSPVYEGMNFSTVMRKVYQEQGFWALYKVCWCGQ